MVLALESAFDPKTQSKLALVMVQVRLVSADDEFGTETVTVCFCTSGSDRVFITTGVEVTMFDIFGASKVTF